MALVFDAVANNNTGRAFRQVRSGLQSVEQANDRVARATRRVGSAAASAQRRVRTFARSAGRALRGVQTQAQRAGRAVAQIGRGAALGGAAGISAGIFGSINFGREARDIQTWADNLGLGVDQIDALNRAAARYGRDGDVIFESLIAAVDRANAAVLAGEESQADFFREFGINAENFINLAPDKALEEMSRALFRIEDPLKRSAVASALFGDEGVRLLPVLSAIAGEEGLQGVVDEVSRTAELLDGPAAEALAKNVDHWENLKNAAIAAGRDLFVRVAPIFQSWTGWLVSTGLPRIVSFIEDGLERLDEYFRGERVYVPEFDEFIRLTPQFQLDVIKLRQEVARVRRQIETEIKPIREYFTGEEIIDPVFDIPVTLKPQFQTDIERIQLAADDVIEFIGDARDTIDQIEMWFEQIGEGIITWLESEAPIATAIRNAGGAAKLIFSPIAELIQTEIRSVAFPTEGLKDRILEFANAGILAAAVALPLFLGSAASRLGRIFRVSIITGILGAIRSADLNPVTETFLSALTIALVIAPERFVNAANRLVTTIFRVLSQAVIGNARISALGILDEIAAVISSAFRFLAGRISTGGLAASIRESWYRIRAHFVQFIRTGGIGQIGQAIEDIIRLAIRSVTPESVRTALSNLASRLWGGAAGAIRGINASVIWTAFRDALVAGINAIRESSIITALANFFKNRVFPAITWRNLVRGLGIGILAQIIIDEIVNQFTDQNSLNAFLRDILPAWTLSWSTLWAEMRDSFTIVAEDAVNAVIDAINSAAGALNSAQESLLGTTLVNVPTIGRVTFAAAARERLQIQANVAAGLDEFGHPRATGARGLTYGTGVRPAGTTVIDNRQITITTPTGTLPQEVIETLAAGFILGEQQGLIR